MIRRPGRFGFVLLAFSALLAMPLCVGRAGASDELADDEEAAAIPDPFEAVNRQTLRFNMGLDRWVIDPITRAYTFIMPQPGRLAVRRVLANLNSPVVFVNDTLQLEPVDAAVTAGRFAINTTVGLVGLFDIARRVGLAPHESDFGQTLALCGVPSGPYVMLPMFGPSSARDSVGNVVDFFFRPYVYLLGPGAIIFWTPIHEGSVGISEREEHGADLRALQATSIDFYAAMKSAWAQDRYARIWARREGRGPLAFAKRALRSLPFGASGREVGDSGAHGGDQGVEALSLQN